MHKNTSLLLAGLRNSLLCTTTVTSVVLFDTSLPHCLSIYQILSIELTSWTSVKQYRFAFGSPCVRMLTLKSAVQSERFCGFLQLIQANDAAVL